MTCDSHSKTYFDFTVKALSWDDVDLMLACRDTSAFDRQEGMSKEGGKPGLRIPSVRA